MYVYMLYLHTYRYRLSRMQVSAGQEYFYKTSEQY